jgi:hypothetical protein
MALVVFQLLWMKNYKSQDQNCLTNSRGMTHIVFRLLAPTSLYRRIDNLDKEV